jgi:glucosamine-6-phosphate deaminase
MRLRTFPTATDASRACAQLLAELLQRHPAPVLGLPTGRTPLDVYRQLVALKVSFARARTFNLDEFEGLAPDDPGSFRAYMQRHLFAHVDLPPGHIHFLDGLAPDAEAECRRYDAALAAAGGLDLCLLGVGRNGHLAFNEPGDALQAPSHRVRLTRETREANAALFGGEPSRVPTHALTLGMGSILQARKVVLLAFGQAKADAIRAALEGSVTPRWPVSFLQLHADAELWTDTHAGR